MSGLRDMVNVKKLPRGRSGLAHGCTYLVLLVIGPTLLLAAGTPKQRGRTPGLPAYMGEGGEEGKGTGWE